MVLIEIYISINYLYHASTLVIYVGVGIHKKSITDLHIMSLFIFHCNIVFYI